MCLKGDDSDEDDNIFKNLTRFVPSGSPVAAPDELAMYLGSPPEQPEGGNALQWWHRQRTTYPRLSLMALDYLSIPCEYIMLPV